MNHKKELLGSPNRYTLAPKYPDRDYFKAKVYLFGYMDPWGMGLASKERTLRGKVILLMDNIPELSLYVILYYIILYYILFYNIILYYIILYYIRAYYIILC